MMTLFRITACQLFVILSFFVRNILALPSAAWEEEFYSPSDTISCDVAVIGGGSSGTYTAVRLQELKKSFVVIEKEPVLGGHTNTYHDPATGTTVDYGVLVYYNESLVVNYFEKFNISLKLSTASPSSQNSVYADFNTGKILKGYENSHSNTTALQLALEKYAEQLDKYPRLAEGWYLPDPVPAELLMPFGDFVKKYSLEALADLIYGYAQGFGHVYDTLTVYIFRYFSSQVLGGIKNGFLTTADHDNHQLYDRALTALGNSVLLNSTVVSTNRAGSGVKLIVQTPAGKKLIKAQKIVSTIPPVLENLSTFDLSSKEHSIFKQFRGHGYFTALVGKTGIPENTVVTNYAPKRPYNFPLLPGTYTFVPTAINGVFNALFGSFSSEVPDKKVQQYIVDDLNRLADAGTINKPSGSDFVAFQNHSPYELQVSADAIKAGFYKDLYSLQGEKNTFWTGAAFQAHDSSLCWNFTETLLPRIVEGLR